MHDSGHQAQKTHRIVRLLHADDTQLLTVKFESFVKVKVGGMPPCINKRMRKCTEWQATLSDKRSCVFKTFRVS